MTPVTVTSNDDSSDESQDDNEATSEIESDDDEQDFNNYNQRVVNYIENMSAMCG